MLAVRGFVAGSSGTTNGITVVVVHSDGVLQLIVASQSACVRGLTHVLRPLQTTTNTSTPSEPITRQQVASRRHDSAKELTPTLRNIGADSRGVAGV